MIIVISVILYLILFIFSDKNNKSVVTKLSILIFAIILLANNGNFVWNDYPEYLKLYLGHQGSVYGDLDVKDGYDLEKPYAYFIYIVRFLLPRMPYSYILCYGLMWILPIAFLLKKGSNNIPLSLFLVCSILNCSQLLFIITAQRQMIANVSIMWAFYIFQFTDYKRKKKVIFIAALLILAILSHSSSYFVVPILIIAFFVKMPGKKILIALMALSFVAAPYIQNLLRPLFYGIMYILGSGDEIARSTDYFINEIYAPSNSSMYASLLPLTLIGITLVYFYSKEEMLKYGPKLMIISIITFNLFNSIPLLNRGLMILFILGAILGIPKVIGKKQKFHIVFGLIGLLLIATTINGYIKGGDKNRLFPYPYIWEEPSPFKLYSLNKTSTTQFSVSDFRFL